MAGIPQVITEDRASGAQFIDGSLKFDKDKNLYLTRTGSLGNRKTWTWSSWVKKDTLGTFQPIFFGNQAGSGNTGTGLRFNDADQIDFYQYTGSSFTYRIVSNRVFRDIGWYHIVVAFDTTQSTAADRIRIYVNGEQVTSWSTATYPNQNTDWYVNNNTAQYIGAYNFNDAVLDNKFDGTLSQCYLIDGQALGPEEFGYTDPLTNTWRPKKYEGDYNVGPASGLNGVIWSNYITGTPDGSYPLSNCFGGNIGSGYTNGTRHTSPGTLTLSIASLNLNVTNVKLHTYIYNTPSTFTVNGTTVPRGSGNGDKEYVVAVNGQLNTVAWSYDSTSGPYCYMKGIEVDLGDGAGYRLLTDGAGGPTGVNSFYLPMDGNSPIGEDKSGIVTPNDGRTWSASLSSSSGFRSSEPKQNAFDGNTGSICSAVGSGTITFTSPVTFASNSTIKVFLHGGDHTVTVNGGADQTISAGSFQTVTYSNSGNATFTMTFHRGGGADTGVRAIEINGVILTDGVKGNSWTPVNFGGSNTIEKATGALPILNTDGGGNTARPGTRNDAYASDIVMAIPFLSNANDISADIRGSGTNLSVTTSGSPAADSDPTQWYGSSFNVSTGNYINTIGTTTTFAFLHQPEVAGTVEGWINTNAVNVQGPWFQTSNGTSQVGLMIRQNSNTNLAVQINRGVSGQAIVIDSSVAVGHNRWYHWAFVKSADGYAQFFLNGVPTGSKVPISTAAGASNAASTNTSSSFAGRIAKNNGETRGVGANICDYRAYTIQKYAFDTPFIPASSNPDILPDTPSGITGKTNLTKITEGAVSFDGSGDYLSLADSDDFDLAGNDWTIEAFVYHSSTNYTTYEGILAQWALGSGTARTWTLETVGSGATSDLEFYYVDSSNNFVGPVQGGTLTKNKWHHVAACRSGNTIRMFVDGVMYGSGTTINVDIKNSTDPLWVGRVVDGYWNGHISNARVVNGTALYTSNFIPPTAPLTNVTNTKLLCCQSNSEGPQKTAVIPSVTGTATAMWPLDSDINDDSGNDNSLTENGGSTSFTSAGTNSFGLSNCVDFAADGKYLSYAVTPASAWTIDGYIKFDDVSSGSNSYVLGWNGTNGSDTTIGLTKSNSTFTVWGSSNLSTTTVAETGRWYHVRLTTNSTSDLALYVDGVLAGRSTSSDGSPASPITIGDMQSGRFNGQIAGVRYVTTDLGAPPLGGETTSSGVTSNSPSVGVGLAGDVAATNFNPFTDDINAIRGQESNYATFNPLQKNPGVTLSNGNLKAQTTNNAWKATQTTIGMKTGKFYWEFGPRLWRDSNNHCQPGVAAAGYLGDSYEMGATNYTAFYHYSGTKFFNGQGGAGTAFGQSWNDTEFNIIGIAFDADTRKVWFSRNGVWQGGGDPGAGTNEAGIINLYGDGTYRPTLGQYGSLNGGGADANFGQKPFRYTPPDGFQPLNLSNVQPEKVIARPDKYVGVSLWTGNGLQKEIGGSKPSENAIVVGGTLTNASNAFNGSGANWATLAATNTSTAASVDFAVNLTGITRIEAAFDSPSGSGDTRGRYNGANAGNTRTGTGSGYSDIYNGSAITVTSVGFAINQNGTSGTSSDIVSRFRITDSQGTRFILDGGGEPLNFKPDLVWIKSRSFSNNHHLFDSVRGPNKILRPSTTDQETTVNVMTSFNNGGFTVAEAGGNNATNDDTSTFVGWTWKAGGSKGTFNVDDVGYANASDVGMNVGGLNSSAYTTISSLTSNLTNTIPTGGVDVLGNWFNGQKSNKFEPSGSGSIDFTSVSELQNFSGTLQFAVSAYNPNSAMQFTINASSDNLRFNSPSFPASGGFPSQLLTIPVTSLETLDFVNYSGSSVQFWAIYLDGKMIVDSTSTPDNVPSIAATGSSVGTKQGFSIVSYTGTGESTASIPHGLEQSPDFVIIKNRDGGTSGSAGGWWSIYHDGFPNNHMFGFNNIDPSTSTWNNHGLITRNTSNVVQVANGDHSSANNWWTHSNGADYIMYSWHNVPGLQKFGSYTGNGSSNGPFIELGFLPSIIIIKRSDGGTENWTLWDASRNPTNVMGKQLYLNLNNAEADAGTNSSYGILDFVSNGVKIRGSHSSFNSSGNTFIYCAWAEAPTVNLYGGQSNAR